jgi:apolipoprotein D and lipocalin family protein
MQALLPLSAPEGRNVHAAAGAPAAHAVPALREAGPAPDADDLDTRIRQAERDLIARDERVLHQVKVLGERLKRARDPRRWAVPALATAVALAGAWWLWRRHGPSAFVGRHSGSDEPWRRRDRVHDLDLDRGRDRDRDSGHPRLRGAGAALGLVGGGRLLMQWLPVVWPLIPPRWRPPLNPTSASSLLAFGLQLARRRWSTAATVALRTAPHVDLRRYAGTWYEIARLPEPHEEACRDQPRATYTPRGQFVEVLNRCRDAHGEERRARGLATVQPGSGNAKLKVTFAPPLLHWLPVVWADYWILYVDADYSVALVGNPARDRLWLLARQPTLEPAALRAVVDIARVQGFPTDQLMPSQRV